MAFIFMSVGLAIMTKTPGHSPVKTRLAATHGVALATEMQRRTAAATASAVTRAAAESGLQAYWAIAETTHEAATGWADFDVMHQSGAGLGERMAGVYNALLRRHTAAILIGTDSPQMRPDWLCRAAAWLLAEQPRSVIGPATDGGFWLFGGNQVIPVAVWNSVPYSQPATREAFLQAVAGYGEVLVLETLSDVDEAADIAALGAGLRQLPAPTPVQDELLAWLETMSQ